MFSRRRTRRAFAAVFAVVAHAVLFAGLVLGRRPQEQFVEPPAVNVALVAPPARTAPPQAAATPSRQVLHRPPTAAPTPAPVIAPPPEPAGPGAQPSDAERAALAQAPFARGPPRGPRLRERCESGHIAEADREACNRILLGRGWEKRDEDPNNSLVMATKRKEAIRSYKNSTRMDDFPGLRCSFGRACRPAPPGP